MHCLKCGYESMTGAIFCSHCGERFPSASTQSYPDADYGSGLINAAPLRAGEYVAMLFLTGIPLVGLILLLFWAFGSTVNLNKRNYARAALILGIIGSFIVALLTAAAR